MAAVALTINVALVTFEDTVMVVGFDVITIGATVAVTGVDTVISFELDTPEPSLAAALTVTVPAPVPASKPASLMVAVPVPAITDQVTLVSVTFAGYTKALICRVAPFTTVVAFPALFTVILVTSIGAIAMARIV